MSFLNTIKHNEIIQVVILVGVIYLFMTFFQKEKLSNTSSTSNYSNAPTPPAINTMANSTPIVAQPQIAPDSLANLGGPPHRTATQNMIESIVSGPTQLTTKDLLPVYNDASKFAKQNPVSQILKDQNFVEAGYHIGINTVIQSNKIPYLDLRSCPPIPKQEVGPWNQSSFEEPAGGKRRYLEIGA